MRIRSIVVAIFLTSAFLAPAAGATDVPAGTIVDAAGGNGNGATENQLSGPREAAIDATGTLYIADTENHRVQRITFDDQGDPTYTTVAGTDGQGGGATELYEPADIAPASDGSLFVVDTWNHRLQRVTFDVDGNPEPATTVYGAGLGYDSSQNGFAVPSGLVIAPDGTMYISDRDNHRIQRIKLNDQGLAYPAVTVAGGEGRGSAANQLDEPYGVALDAEGSLYIVDSENHRVQKITFDENDDPDGVTTAFGGIGQGDGVGQLNTPYGVAVRSDGSIYIADAGNDRVIEVTFDENGEANEEVVVAGGNGRGWEDNQFNTPSGLTLDGAGSLYVADPYNHRVRKLTLGTIAGTPDDPPGDSPDADVTPPSIHAPPPAAARVGGSTVVNFSCKDIGDAGVESCTATLDGKPVLNGDIMPAAQRGLYELIVTAIDAEGNSSTTTVTFAVYGARELAGEFKEISGEPASVARLYLAAFERVPEGPGFEYWKSSIDGGMSLYDMAIYFANGAEFLSSYDTTSNVDFVELMYQRVMARQAEPEGRAFWKAQLDSGMPKAELLLWFSGSPEFKEITFTS